MVATIKFPKMADKQWLSTSGVLSSDLSGALLFDMTETKNADSAVISFIIMKRKECRRSGSELQLKNASREILDLIDRWDVGTVADTGDTESKSLLLSIGDSALLFKKELTVALSILVEMLYWGTLGLLKRRDFRKGVLGEQMYQLGFAAIGIVSLLSFLIGIVLSIQSAIQLKQFGADVFLIAMITWSMVRELGPLMTAIILAGRSGSATAAEIATMSVQEEVDALKTMGLNHIQFIVVPKFWAITITMPILVLFSIATGILGGFMVSTFYLNLTPQLFWSEMVKNVILKDFLISFFKSIVFAWLIIWIGAYHGFKVRGGAEEVGKETTSSVVSAIFIIIIADAIFSFVYNINF